MKIESRFISEEVTNIVEGIFYKVSGVIMDFARHIKQKPAPIFFWLIKPPSYSSMVWLFHNFIIFSKVLISSLWFSSIMSLTLYLVFLMTCFGLITLDPSISKYMNLMKLAMPSMSIEGFVFTSSCSFNNPWRRRDHFDVFRGYRSFLALYLKCCCILTNRCMDPLTTFLV